MIAFSKAAVATMAAAILLCGCIQPVKLAVPPAQEVMIEPGKLTIDGQTQTKPWDTFYTFADGKLYPHSTAFRIEPLIGVDLVGLEASPWAGVRFFHVDSVGADVGFNRTSFTGGVDFLWHDLVVGAGPSWPFDLSASHLELHAAVWF